METEGIEPSSEKTSQKTSTSLVDLGFSPKPYQPTGWFRKWLKIFRYLPFKPWGKYHISTGLCPSSLVEKQTREHQLKLLLRKPERNFC